MTENLGYGRTIDESKSLMQKTTLNKIAGSDTLIDKRALGIISL